LPLSDKLTSSLSAFAHAVFARPLTDAQADNIAGRVIDTLACMAAAAHEGATKPVVQALMLAGGQGACPVLFAGATALTQAATANSYLSRCLDWNDTYIGKNGGHPSDIIAGAITTGAWAGKNGDRILRAIAAGTHAMMDLCDSADAMSRGWDHATYVGLAATIANGLLLDLEEQLGHAIAMTAVSNNVLVSRYGKISTWKSLASPAAVRTAIENCLLARAGATGPDPVFEGDNGFMNRISGLLAPELDAARDRTGDTHLKPYQAVYHAQAPIELALRLRDEIMAGHGSPPEAGFVDRAHVTTYSFGIKHAADNAAKWKPETPETADHSIPFLVALALARGGVDHASLAGAINDEKVLALTARVSISADAEMDATFPQRSPAKLLVRAGGRTFIAEVPAHKGNVTRPLAREEIDAKLVGAATPAIGEARASEWTLALRGMAKAATIDALLRP
jgi:2-methylcitrate dehydratase